jgi:hypothetical protein
MADDPIPDTQAPPLNDVAQAIVAELLNPKNLEKWRKHAQNAALETAKDMAESAWSTRDWFLEKAANIIISATDAPASLLDPLARGAIESLLKDEIGGRHGTANAGARLIQKLSGPGGSPEPGIAGAERYLTIILHEQVEAWLRGLIVEFVTEYLPEPFGIGGGIENVQKLQEIVENMLGGGRMIRRVLQPFLSATAITPAQWHVNKKYRQELLSASAAVEAFLRGDWTGAQLTEELARQGYSDERINTLVRNAQRRLSFDDLMYQHFRGELSDLDVIEQARDLGYDEVTARAAFHIASEKRYDRWKDPMVDAAVAAFVRRDITEFQCRSIVDGAAPSLTEAAYIMSSAKVRRELNVPKISHAELRGMVRDRILTVAHYRRRLERDGYAPEDIDALELSLLADMQADRDVAAARRQQEQERAQARAERAKERAAREAELRAKAARTFPSLAELARAAVRGLVPIDRYGAELVRLRYAPDDVEFLVAGVEAERAAFLAAETRKADADARLHEADLSLADVRQMMLRGLLSIYDYRDILTGRGYSDGEAAQLVALMQAELDDRAQAETTRAARARDLTEKGVSLTAFEAAVRRGLRTLAQYSAFLGAHGFSDLDRALLTDLLAGQLADDTAARQRKADAETRAATRGIGLPALERAVRRGVAARKDYLDALLGAELPPRDVEILMGLLDAQLADDEAARRRRAEIGGEVSTPGLTFAQTERAVRLGLLDLAAYRGLLEAAGYRAADVDLLVGLLVEELQETRAAKGRRDDVTRELRARNVALGDVERAVRRGLRTLDEYRALLATYGYGADDVELLGTLLAEEVAVDLAGLRKKLSEKLAKVDGAPTLDTIEAQLVEGARSPDATIATLTAAGAAADEALVFVRVLLSLEPEG